MNTEKGSVLVGVLAISIVMTLAAGGFILVAGNSSKDIQVSESDLSLHYAAESGANLGVAWIREQPAESHVSWDGSISLNTEPDGYTNINGVQVRISVEGVAGGTPLRRVRCSATKGLNMNVLVITWDVLSVTANGAKCTPVLANWTESYTPGLL